MVYHCRAVPQPGQRLLFLIDGHPATETKYARTDLEPDWIEKIEIVRAPQAVARFGAAAADGAVLITLKREYR
jgi:outer membrane receptor for ferrienterochelin and colicin